MPFELQRKEVTVSAETLTVWQASNLMEMKRSFLMAEANARWKGREVTSIDDEAQKYLETFLYPTLVACTMGNLPTLEEFLHGVPAGDTAVWEDTAQELNPRWLRTVVPKTPEEQAAELEKNE